MRWTLDEGTVYQNADKKIKDTRAVSVVAGSTFFAALSIYKDDDTLSLQLLECSC